MAKITISRDWYKQKTPGRKSSQSIQLHQFERESVSTSEALPEFLTMPEAAKILRVHEKTLRRWAATKEILTIKVKGRRLITPEQLSEFIARQYRKNG